MQVALKVLGYLEQTADNVLRLGFSKGDNQPLVSYTDANWASNPGTGRRSTSGSVTLVFGSTVGWKSHVQRCVALSAVEAEFVAASEVARKILFFRYLLQSIGIDVGIPTVLTDNTGCIQVSKDPAQHWKLKHIDTRYHFIRDHVREASLSIKLIGTKANLSDMFTKPVSKIIIANVNKLIGVIQPQSLRGGVEDAPIVTDETAEHVSECNNTADSNGTASLQQSNESPTSIYTN
jgi:hypothetical protein